MEKTRSMWNAKNKNRMHPIKEQMYQNAVLAVTDAKGAMEAARISVRAADAMKAAADAVTAAKNAAEEDARQQHVLVRAAWNKWKRGEATEAHHITAKNNADKAAAASAAKVDAAVSALEVAASAATAARADATAKRAVMDARKAMETRATASVERLAATAEAVKKPVKSNANPYLSIAHNLTRKANAKRSALAVADVNEIVNAKRNVDRLLAEGQARLPAPAKPLSVLGNEVVPSRFPFMNSVQPASQYHNRQSDGLNELSYE
jgi:hypothetical protein